MSTMNVTRSYTMKELAALYNISNVTLKKWLKLHEQVIGEKVGRLYTPLQVSLIFECLGDPRD